MAIYIRALSQVLSDGVLFPALQVGLAAFALYAAIRNWLQLRSAGRGGVALEVKRGETSMGRFYAVYAAVSGLLVAICLSVDAAESHRILWVIADTLLVAYVCLLNPWFRNTLLGCVARLARFEKR
jgi:hypothetical protein